MNLLRRLAPVIALLALTAARPPAAVAQQPPPPDGGGMGGPPDGDMRPAGPPDPAEMRQRLVDGLTRQMGVDAATFGAMRPLIVAIVQLRHAVEGQARPEPPGRPGGPDGPPARGNGGGGRDADAADSAADPAGPGGGADTAGPAPRHRRPPADDGPTEDGSPTAASPPDADAAELTARVRHLRATLREADEGDDGGNGADVPAAVKAVRDARAKVVAKLAASRTSLQALVKTPRQEAVLVAAGILD